MSIDQFQRIFNEGERLIPGESHDLAELIRHRSSYCLFRSVIETDSRCSSVGVLRILDLGCGVGHGTYTLSELPDVYIVGVDPSSESLEYAEANYHAANITYLKDEAANYLARREEFDYVVSRHAFEHIENGLELALQCKFRRRLMINVPFKEKEGNPHHKIHYITEKSFAGYTNAEFFYEDLQGNTETEPDKLQSANSIVCILSKQGMPKIADIIQFPFPAWKPHLHERLLIEASTSVKNLHTEMSSAKEVIQKLQQEKRDMAHKLEILQADFDVIRTTTLFRMVRKLKSYMRK